MELDHLVYAVPDLEAATDSIASQLGIRPRPGGRHPGLGTHNAILPLAGGIYVELIALDPTAPPPGAPPPFGLDGLERPRLVTWAVRTSSIESDVRRSRERGYDPGALLGMTRTEPSGEVLRWQLAIRREPFGDGLVPFVIDWGDSPHPAAEPDGRGRPGVLERFSAVHPDPQSILHALDALDVELDVSHGESIRLVARLASPSGSLDLD